jgi:hypothetical protein
MGITRREASKVTTINRQIVSTGDHRGTSAGSLIQAVGRK